MKRLILTVAFLFLVGPAFAATPTHDATTSNAQANQTNPSFSHTRGATCPNPVAIIGVSWQDATGTLSSVTYGGSAATSLGARVQAGDGSSNLWTQMFIYKNPASGAATVQVNFSESINQTNVHASTYCNVDQTNSTGTRATTVNGGTSSSVTVTSAVGELVVDLLAVANAPVVTVDASQTSRSNVGSGGNHTHTGSEEAGAASVAMTWSWTGSQNYSAIGISLKPSNDRRPTPPILLQ